MRRIRREVILLWMLGLLLLPGCGAQAATEAAQVEKPTAYMALTFDDGPNETWTPKLLDGLKERNVHCTFFLLGNLAECNDALVWRMAAEGHQIGNHSYDHAKLTTVSEWEAKKDIEQGNAVLREILGEGTYWVRAPYGCLTDGECSLIDEPLIYWSVDTEDWKSRDVNAILDVIYRDSFDGCIILLHDCYETSVKAALEAIDHLTAQGVRFVTLEELFAIKGITPEQGVVYRSAK